MSLSAYHILFQTTNMTKIAQFDGGYLDLRVVRAYAKSEEIREETGILVDFSAKMVLVQEGKKGRKENFVLSLNDLHIRVTRQNVLKIGSQKREYTGAQGKQTVYPISFFPFASQEDVEKTEEQIKFEDAFIDELLQDITNFIRARQGEAEERSKTPRAIPKTAAVQALCSLGDLTALKAKKGKNEDDTPF